MSFSSLQKLTGRIGVALLLVLLASGSVLAAAATLSTAQGPALAEPATESESEAPEATQPAETEAPEATASPDADEGADEGADTAPRAGMVTPEASPSAANLARIVARLEAAGIDTTAEELAALAKLVGVGGAVRVLLFADAAEVAPAEIVALFESGKGWGVIAKELALDVNPGIGSVMGNGHGPDKAAARAEKAAAKASKAAERAAAKAARAAARAERKAGSGG